ncbi:MAG: prepilin-type N-terminal cleavage/methylation domain-containing protein [bacterium]
MVRGLKGKAGFTLIEVMVALGIAGMCLGLVAVSLTQAFEANEGAQEQMELQQSVDLSMDRMRKLIQSAFRSPHPPNYENHPFTTHDTDRSNNPYDAITFTTLAYSTYKIDAKQAELAEITLFTEEEPPLETPEGKLQLRRLRIRAGGEINDRFEVEGGVVYTLADHVTRFKLEYLDEQGEWREEWKTFDHGNQLPCAIKVELGMRSKNLKEKVTSMVVPLQMTGLKCEFEYEKVFEDQQSR